MTFTPASLIKLKSKISGKTVLLFGATFVGKTTLSLHLSKLFNRPVYFRVDKNLPIDVIKEVNPNLEVVDIKSYEQLFYKISDLSKMEDRADFVIIDSLTGLNEELEQRYKPPKLYLELSRWQRMIVYKLALMKPKTTSLIITHSRLADFQTRSIEPSINNKVLKHIDAIYYMYRDVEGKRVVKLWAERKVPEALDVDLEI